MAKQVSVSVGTFPSVGSENEFLSFSLRQAASTVKCKYLIYIYKIEKFNIVKKRPFTDTYFPPPLTDTYRHYRHLPTLAVPTLFPP